MPVPLVLGVEIVDDALVEPVELKAFLLMDLRISGEGLEEPGRQRRVDALEEFEEHETDRVPVREESIPSPAGHLRDKPLALRLTQVFRQRERPPGEVSGFRRRADQGTARRRQGK